MQASANPNEWINDETRIHPTDLISFDADYAGEIINAGFGWRWKTRGNQKFRILTIEGNSEQVSNNSQKISPTQLYSLDSNFTNGILQTHFNWRWFKVDNGSSFRALTIEDSNQSFEKQNHLIKSEQLVWWVGEKHEKSFFFNWRWFERDGTKFRIVTLE